MDTPIIHIEKLSHRYSVQWAVRDINLEIMQHGIYGLLGSNGAGKSTIMNIMCGVLKQTEGDIFIKGINTKTDPVEAKCHIGFCPSNRRYIWILRLKNIWIILLGCGIFRIKRYRWLFPR